MRRRVSPPPSRPNLVPANDTVETLAEPLALVGARRAAGSQRADALGRVARVFFDSYDAFLGDDRDAHWRDVNLAADPSLPNVTGRGLPRRRDGSTNTRRRATLRSTLSARRRRSAADASGGPKAEDSDRLYEISPAGEA